MNNILNQSNISNKIKAFILVFVIFCTFAVQGQKNAETQNAPRDPARATRLPSQKAQWSLEGQDGWANIWGAVLADEWPVGT